MRVCDYCHENNKIKNTIKVNGKDFELCQECSEMLVNKLEAGVNPKKGFAKIGDMFS